MAPTTEELRERLQLLKEIKELEAAMPDEDEMQAASAHLATLQKIEEHASA
jgi:hypothetical protein